MGDSMIERRLLGTIEVDSGALLVGDPGLVLPRAETGREGVDYQVVIDVPMTETAAPLGGRPVLLIQNFGGDGTFDVFGEFEDGELVRIVIELEERDDESDA